MPDKSWYNGEQFDPYARAGREPKNSVRLCAAPVRKPYCPPAASEDEVLAEASGVPSLKVREKRQLEDSALHAAFRFKNGSVAKSADAFLRQHGARLKPALGGSMLRLPEDKD